MQEQWEILMFWQLNWSFKSYNQKQTLDNSEIESNKSSKILHQSLSTSVVMSLRVKQQICFPLN